MLVFFCSSTVALAPAWGTFHYCMCGTGRHWREPLWSVPIAPGGTGLKSMYKFLHEHRDSVGTAVMEEFVLKHCIKLPRQWKALPVNPTSGACWYIPKAVANTQVYLQNWLSERFPDKVGSFLGRYGSWAAMHQYMSPRRLACLFQNGCPPTGPGSDAKAGFTPLEASHLCSQLGLASGLVCMKHMIWETKSQNAERRYCQRPDNAGGCTGHGDRPCCLLDTNTHPQALLPVPVVAAPEPGLPPAVERKQYKALFKDKGALAEVVEHIRNPVHIVKK